MRVRAQSITCDTGFRHLRCVTRHAVMHHAADSISSVLGHFQDPHAYLGRLLHAWSHEDVGMNTFLDTQCLRVMPTRGHQMKVVSKPMHHALPCSVPGAARIHQHDVRAWHRPLHDLFWRLSAGGCRNSHLPDPRHRAKPPERQVRLQEL